jgi:hypothetical protein
LAYTNYFELLIFFRISHTIPEHQLLLDAIYFGKHSSDLDPYYRLLCALESFSKPPIWDPVVKLVFISVTARMMDVDSFHHIKTRIVGVWGGDCSSWSIDITEINNLVGFFDVTCGVVEVGAEIKH